MAIYRRRVISKSASCIVCNLIWIAYRCVQNPLTLTLQQLLSDYDQISCPVTLVCAGNRRKEQNQVRKSKGFSWGAAGVSTAIFTGVLMSDLIRKARPKRGARYVCMEGADKLVGSSGLIGS